METPSDLKIIPKGLFDPNSCKNIKCNIDKAKIINGNK
jgi:hypothetical protein